jgi:TrmH family RNA methyltransferase
MSLTRSQIKDLRSLQSKKHREERGVFLVEGFRLVGEAVASDFEIVEAFHTASFLRAPSASPLVRRLEQRGIPVRVVAERDLDAFADTVHAQGIAAVARCRTRAVGEILTAGESPSVIVALDGISDPGNAGSIIRTADWFGVDGVLLGRSGVELYNPKVVRGTMGGVFHLPIADDADLPAALSLARARGYTVYVTSADGEAHVDRIRYAHRALLVFGNEAWGVSDQVRAMADVRLAIRRYGAAESLNVAVASGIVLSALHPFQGD